MSITVLDEAILWLGNKPAGRAKTRRTPVQPLQNIPDSPDISLNDVSFTSMTVHMEVTPPGKNVTSFDVSWEPHDGAMDSSASNVYITGLDEATTYTFFGWAKSGNQRNSADASATTVEYSRRYFAQRRVLHFHDCAWRRLRRRQECYEFRRFLGTRDGAMDTRMPMSTSLDEATAYFLWMGKNPAGIGKLGGCQCNHRTIFPILPIFRSTTCPLLLTMETVYAADKECHGFRCFLDSTTVPWIARMPRMSTSRVGRSYKYTFWMGEEFRRNQRKLADASATTVQNIPDSPDISLNDVSLLP
jgi:hypothetical protein